MYGLLLLALLSCSHEGQTFRTAQCRVHALPADTPRPEGDRAYSRWAPPASVPVDLTAVPGRIDGDVPDVEPLLSLGPDDLATWERTVDGDTVRWLGPTLQPSVRGGHLLHLRVRPSGATSITVTASPDAEIARRQRGLRSTTFSLDAPPEIVELTVDLKQVVTGNWGDDQRGVRALRRVEVAVPIAWAEGFELLDLWVTDELAGLTAPAEVRTADVDAVRRRSWVLHDGAEVSLPVQVPASAPELRWYGGALGPSAEVLVSVRDGDALTELGTYDEGRSAWVHRRVSLQPWAGRNVEIVLRARSASGAGLVGAPRVVSSDQPRDTTPDVIVYLIDTLRADHLGAWGSPVPGVSPTIDELAATGVQFTFTISSSPWTKPAIPTVLTGLWSMTHGVGSRSYTDRLPDTVSTLQDQLREAGWRTGSFTSNPLGSTLSGLDRGFETAVPPTHWRGDMPDLRHPSADQLHEALLSWWDEEPDLPVFAYVHTLEPHAWRRDLYADPPEGFRPYDAAVQDADTKLGRLLASLRESGRDRNLLLVVLADHGESFGDHGVTSHGKGVWQSQVHIPLVFWAGEALPAFRTSALVGLADVAPTVVDLVGLEPIDGADGTSLVPIIDGGAGVHETVPAARVRYVWEPDAPRHFAIVGSDHRKIVRVEGGGEYTFDLSRDLCEGRSTRADPELHAALDAWLAAEEAEAEAFRAAHGSGESEGVSSGDVDMLRQLGYLE